MKQRLGMEEEQEEKKRKMEEQEEKKPSSSKVRLNAWNVERRRAQMLFVPATRSAILFQPSRGELGAGRLQKGQHLEGDGRALDEKIEAAKKKKVEQRRKKQWGERMLRLNFFLRRLTLLMKCKRLA